MSFGGTSLVTGALGQDGFILCQRLQALAAQNIAAGNHGAEVLAIARPGGQNQFRRDMLINIGCRVIELDVRNVAAMVELIEAAKPKRIFHLAATHHSSNANSETPEIWESMTAVNVAATETLANAVVRTRMCSALIYASSSQIWTPRKLEHRVDETTPIEPATFYGRTKIAATDLLRQFRTHDGLRASVAVLFNHESPLRSPNFVTRKVTTAAARASCGATEKLHLINLGACVDWQAASDVVEGLLLMAKSDAPDDYVLASGHGRSVRELVEIAYRRVGLEWQQFVTAERDEPSPFLVGIPDKATRQLGWQRRRTFEDLIGGMVDADVARLRGEILP